MQAAFSREFDIEEWDDIVAMANGGYGGSVDDLTEESDEQQRIKVTHSAISDGLIAYLADKHFPFHDAKAIALAAKLLLAFAPDEVIDGGDGQDMYAVSSFDKDPKRVLCLQDELDVGYKYNRILRDATPEAKWYELDSNHEARWDRYLHSHPEISGLRALELHNLMRFDDLGWEYGGTERWYCGGALAFLHGTRCSKHAGWAAKAELESRFFQQHVVQGHNHKVGYYSARGPLNKVEGYEVGCLCDLEPEYVNHPNWNQGIMFVTIYNSVPTFENIIFQKDESGTWASFRGKVYRG
jgi:hypothetical protein